MSTNTTTSTFNNYETYGTRAPRRAGTANEAAAIVFPQIGQHFHAFWEDVNGDLEKVPQIHLLDLNDDFWALTIGPAGTPQSPTVFVSSESQFRRYNPNKGIYEPISEAAVVGEILGNLDLCSEFLPPTTKAAGFIALKNRQRLKSVVDRARDLLAVENDWFQDRQHLHLAFANGVLQIDSQQFHPSDPSRPVRETLPVNYDPNAKCELFTKAFLQNILSTEDVDLLQRYSSQILEGINHSQTILVLMGESGWGKSSLMKILGTLIGWQRVGIVREQLFRDEFELSHYAGKHLLYHPDMPTDFLERREASVFKQLVGHDPLWANVRCNKGEEGRMVLEGHFPVILACNGKPRIHLDQDTDAWTRRLVVLSFKKPGHEQHMGKMAELILKQESSGILNWLLEGRAKLAKDKLQLTQTPEQKTRAAVLLMASDSPAVFVRSCLVKKKECVVGVVDLYEKYQVWCKTHQLLPFSSKQFSKIAKTEIEMGLGLKSRHDLVSGAGVMRGWKGLAVKEAESAQIVSKESGA